MPTASLRLALLATAFALPGVLLAQAPAPAASPAPSASAPPKGPSAPKASKSATPATPATAAAGAAPSGAATGAAPSGGSKRNKSSSNAQGAAGATGSAGGAPAKSARSKEPSGPPKTVGMQRAFADLQTNAEFEAYRDKAQAVKTVGECKTLMEETKKQLEPRAKAQNKPLNVDIDKACSTAKERKGLTG